MSERAAEGVRKRVDGLAEEVANLGEIVRRSNASTATALEQLLADEQRSRCRYSCNDSLKLKNIRYISTHWVINHTFHHAMYW